MAFTSRLILTHRCNAKCPHCFNVEERSLLSKDDDMDYDKLQKYLHHNTAYFRNKSAKIMGGEPTIHERFVDIIKLCLSHYSSVRIFSNGMAKAQEVLLSDQYIIDYIIHGDIDITFNSLTFADQRWLENLKIGNKMNLWQKPIHIHFVVNERNSKFLLSKMKRIVSTFPGPYYNITISSDVGVNIFNKEEREAYKETWKTFVKEARKIVGPQRVFSWDHAIPLCFFDDEMSEFMYSMNKTPLRNNCLCSHTCSGLIDPDFSVWFCNQFRHKVGNVFEKGDVPLSYTEIDNKLRDARIEKSKILIENVGDCASCPALEFCKGGCFCNQLIR